MIAIQDWLTPARLLFLIIHILGLACFTYIAARRIAPLVRAERDFRFDRTLVRAGRLLQYWLAQWRHPRYRFAGTIHILIFAGFLLLATRAFYVIIFGFPEQFVLGVEPGAISQFYGFVTDWATTVVFVCAIIAAIRRMVFRPARYAVPARYGKGHPADAIFLLGLIALLMFADSLFVGSAAAAQAQQTNANELATLTLPWAVSTFLATADMAALWNVHLGAFFLHQLTFYFLLCYRPFGIQFHVETSQFSVYFAKLDRGTVKPVRWGVTSANLDQVKSFGVKTFEDFTWKHMLDFYSCADCGRCSDNCPANAAGRPLSPRFLTIKARDYCFQHYPVLGSSTNGQALIGNLYSEDEIWSCTTCGACEEECPLLIEYIDKIVDLRRGLVDDGNVPQSLQKPLKALESRGNPYGKLDKKRGEWAKKEFQQACRVKVLDGKNGGADTLYFVDSITSYDDRIQAIGRATARILDHCGENFGILGAAERDSGHDVRRFGEEMLFLSLRDHNADAIKAAGVNRIVTADPHAYNALKHDYTDIPQVEHISQYVAREVKQGHIKLSRIDNEDAIYTYHDPCYLGRHNQIYDDPREVLDSIPGLKRVEMNRCRDRSFCCGGGGLMLFYEPKEDERIGVKRVRMAAEAGANVIVTACPFCMVNIEDAIKVAALEGKMTAIDLAELVDLHTVRQPQSDLERTQPTELVKNA
ncbi:MAG TPA: (Fe-S)-binding protein [Terriglobales bacterium]|nr:(Fe-S)-binding protein [Terriglobales bacterium]